MSERKLKAWQAAGVIDGATAQRIRAYEAAHGRPVGLWAVVGVAALAMGLGVISLVAANWDALPGETRLGVHAGMLVALGAGLALGGRMSALVQDAGVFLFALLALGFLGHVGQVYQTASPPWMALGLWLGLVGPALLALGQGWLCALLVVGGSVALAWLRVDDPGFGQAIGNHGPGLIRAGVECALPVWLVPLGLAAPGGRAEFWRRMVQTALAYGVGAVSLLVLVAGWAPWADHDGQSASMAVAFVAGAAGLAAWRVHRGALGQAVAAALGLLAIAVLAAYGLSGSAVAAGLLFLALWAGLAMAALHASQRSLFQLAVAIIALRLIALSFEAAGGLLASGLGLIIGGAITLAVAWAAWRISRRYAPARVEAGA